MSTLNIGVGHRNLEHYPSNGRRIWYLALAVIATIMLDYESYVLPSVAPYVLHYFGLTVLKLRATPAGEQPHRCVVGDFRQPVRPHRT